MSQERSVRKDEVVRSGFITRLVLAVTVCLALMCFCTTLWALELGMVGAPANDGNVGTSLENTAIGPNANASTYSGGSGVWATAVGANSTATGYASTASGDYSTASGYGSAASGSSSTAVGAGSMAVGAGSTASGYASTASGVQSAASGTDSTALGHSAASSGTNSVALGANSTDGGEANVVSVGSAGQTRRITNVTAGVNPTDAVNVSQLQGAVSGNIAVNNTSGYANPSATGNDSMAVGAGAVASAANSLAVGSNARATGTNAIAIGSGALATGSVAVGTGATASNGGSAFGDFSTATGTASAAVGQGATSTGANSVAIGSNSTDGGQANVVSVGSAGNERRITNVAPGVNSTDAVNVSQLGSLSDKVEELDRDAHRGIAGAIALSRAYIPLNPGESGMAVGVGTSNGQTAVAVSLQYYTKKNIHVNIGTSVSSGSRVQAGGGIGFKF